MRNRPLLIGAAVVVIVLCVLFIRATLLQIPRQQALAQFLDRHLPPLDKNKRRLVLLAPEERFLPLAPGLDMAFHRLLPLPRRFAPIDYQILSGFSDLWLVTTRDRKELPLEGSLFTRDRRSASREFQLTRLTLPSGITFTDFAGNPGGGAYNALCPDGGSVRALALTVGDEGIFSAAPLCRDPKRGERKERSAGDVKKGRTVTLSCPGDAPPTGITFYGDKAIRGMTLRCPTDSAVFDAAAIPSAGRIDLPAATRNCPEGLPLRGLYGGAGALIDSLGLICGK